MSCSNKGPHWVPLQLILSHQKWQQKTGQMFPVWVWWIWYKNTKASILACLVWCNVVGNIFFAHFGTLSINWVSVKHHSLPEYCCWPRSCYYDMGSVPIFWSLLIQQDCSTLFNVSMKHLWRQKRLQPRSCVYLTKRARVQVSVCLWLFDYADD